ncbi:MAG: CcmD family protein [Candidatus Hydrothermarchaeota archaeon]
MDTLVGILMASVFIWTGLFLYLLWMDMRMKALERKMKSIERR